MTTAVQAPEELLDGQPDFPYEPVFREWEGLRLAHVDVGDGPPVVMWHGEPTWSFLWRKVLPSVVGAGYRVICPTSRASAAPTSLPMSAGTRTIA